MLRVTWLFLAEAVAFATLSALLFCMPTNAVVARVVASVLTALVVVIVIVVVGQRRVLAPLLSAVGLVRRSAWESGALCARWEERRVAHARAGLPARAAHAAVEPSKTVCPPKAVCAE